MTPTKLKKPRKPKSADVIKSKSDEKGNLLVIRNNGKRILLSLKLVSEKRYRKIGMVNLAQKTFECKRNREKHLFRKGNSYGFNVKLLEDAKLFSQVRLIDNYDEWLIPKQWILDNGKYLFFSSVGFEKQIFVNLVDAEQFKRPAKI